MARPAKKVIATELTREQALAEIQKLRAQLEAAQQKPVVEAAPAASPEQLAELAALRSAVIASHNRENAAKRLAEQASNEAVFEVRNVVDMALSALVRDTRGHEMVIQWPQRGSIQYLTAAQVFELQERTRAFFDKGYLVAPELVAPSVNLIEDFDKFIAEGPEATTPVIAEMDSVDVLTALYHHINSLRFRITDDVSTIPSGASGLVHVPLAPQVEVTLHAVTKRVFDLTKIRLSTEASL